MTAREEMLGRIRQSLGDRHSADLQAEYQSIPRNYSSNPGSSLEERLILFSDRLRDYGATVHRCSASAVKSVVDTILTERQKNSLLVPAGIPREWLPEGRTFIHDDELTFQAMDASQGVLTGCAMAIALTGTIILQHTRQTGRRALTLIPDYHLCVVYTDQVLETPPEGIRKMAQLLPAPLTTISGPSATSDIEMIRVKGVHGPRTLEVILADR